MDNSKYPSLSELLSEINDKDLAILDYPWGSAIVRMIRNNDGYKLPRNPVFHDFYDWLHGLDFKLMNYVVLSRYRSDLDMFVNTEAVNPFREDRTKYENIVDYMHTVSLIACIGIMVDSSMRLNQLRYADMDISWVRMFISELGRLVFPY